MQAGSPGSTAYGRARGRSGAAPTFWYISNSHHGGFPAVFPQMAAAEEEALEVEQLIEERVVRLQGKKARKEYFVKWQGYGSDENTWE